MVVVVLLSSYFGCKQRCEFFDAEVLPNGLVRIFISANFLVCAFTFPHHTHAEASSTRTMAAAKVVGWAKGVAPCAMACSLALLLLLLLAPSTKGK